MIGTVTGEGMRMKPRKAKAKRTRKEAVSLRGMLAQPPSAFYRLPEFELRGGYLVTEGCRRVLDLNRKKSAWIWATL